MKTLYFFTDTFPLGGITEQSFILPEINAIDKSFDRVTILPESKMTTGKRLDLPAKFIVDQSLCNMKRSRSEVGLLLHLFNPFVFSLLYKEKRRIKNKSQFFSFLRYIDKSILYKAYVEDLLRKKAIDPQNTIFYSFWFTEITFALAMLCKKYDLNIYCRAHGYDIYDERVLFRSHSIRMFTLSKMQTVYPCSKNGKEYISKQYPLYSDKIKVSYLGCEKLFDTVNPKSANGKSIIFFTCARLHKVKRLPMTFGILSEVAQYYGDKQVKWVIVGEGEERVTLENLISNNKCGNFEVELLGALSNKDIHDYYAKNHIDFGILLSESEGLSISVCEQIAYKIPGIVTNVGGLPEIINDSNGILLSSEPTSNELISKLTRIINDVNLYDTICNNAYATWKKKFKSDINRMEFIEKLSLIDC